jgi:hypothetical protein
MNIKLTEKRFCFPINSGLSSAINNRGSQSECSIQIMII